MQVVPSQRMTKPFRASPLALYRALRTINSFAIHVLFRLSTISTSSAASPEILARLEGDTVTVRPIAGTRRRGATPSRMPALAMSLLGRREGARRARHARGPGDATTSAASRRTGSVR
jgi:anthranilate synthase component 1